MMRKLASSGVSKLTRPNPAAAVARRGYYPSVAYPEAPRPISEVPGTGRNGTISQLAKICKITDENGVARSGIDNHSWAHLIKWVYRNYAPETNLFSMRLPGFGNVYYIADPNEFMKVTRAEGKYPHSGAVNNWPMKAFYRRNQNRKLEPILMANEEWKKFRTVMQKDLISPKSARGYVGAMAKAARIASDVAKDHEHRMDDFTSHASFDVFSSVLFGRTMKTVLGPEEGSPEGMRLCEAIRSTTAQVLPMMRNPLEYVADRFGYMSERAETFDKGFNKAIDIGEVFM